MKLLLSEHSGVLGCFIFLSRILLTLSVDTGGINVGQGSANNGEIRECLRDRLGLRLRLRLRYFI